MKSKTGKTIGIIVAVIVVGIIIQYARKVSATNGLQSGIETNLPVSYFPFNGNYQLLNGKVTKV